MASREEKIAELRRLQKVDELKRLQQNPYASKEAESLKETIKPYAETAFKVMNYPVQLGEALAAKLATINPVVRLAQELSGKELYKEGDIEKAISGQGPSESEYLQRVGVPQTGADLAGLLANMALTHKAGIAAGEKVKSTGEKVYKLPFRSMDELATQRGAPNLPSELFLENRKTVQGTKPEVARATNALIDDYLSKRSTIIDDATKAGKTVDLTPYNEEVKAKIMELKSKGDPFTRKVAEAAEVDLAPYFTGVMASTEVKPRVLQKEIPAVTVQPFQYSMKPGKKIFASPLEEIKTNLEISNAPTALIKAGPKEAVYQEMRPVINRKTLPPIQEISPKVPAVYETPEDVLQRYLKYKTDRVPTDIVELSPDKKNILTKLFEPKRTTPSQLDVQKSSIGSAVSPDAFKEVYTQRGIEASAPIYQTAAGQRKAALLEAIGKKTKEAKAVEELGNKAATLMNVAPYMSQAAIPAAGTNVFASAPELVWSSIRNPLLSGAVSAKDVFGSTWATTKGGNLLMDLGNFMKKSSPYFSVGKETLNTETPWWR